MEIIGPYIQCSGRELPEGLVSVPHISEYWQDPAYSRCQGATENKRELSSLLPLQRTSRKRPVQLGGLYLGWGQEKSGECTTFHLFLEGGGGGAWGTSFCLLNSESWWDLAYSKGLQRTKESWVACSSSRESVVPQTKTRGNKKLQALGKKKKNWKILLIRNLHILKSREGTSTEKVWEASRICSWANWWRSFPVQSQFIKNWER